MIVLIRELKEGITEFEETVPVEKYPFLQASLFSDPLSLRVYIDRLDEFFRVKIGLSTHTKSVCDRCLEEFPVDYTGEIEQLYQIGHSELDGDEIEILPADAKEIDLSDAIHEMLVISRPIRVLCSEDCKGLCVHCGANRNTQDCGCSKDAIDLRLEKLKTLLK